MHFGGKLIALEQLRITYRSCGYGKTLEHTDISSF